MSSASRRDFVQRCAAVAIASSWALNSYSVSAKGAPAIRAPNKPMRLRRQVVRDLIDGKQLIVTRDWKVDFQPSNKGWRVSGAQLDVDVKVPVGLEPLATLERSRSTSESFPLYLNQHGLIVSEPAKTPQLSFAQIADAAHDSVRALGDKALRHSEVDAFLAQMQRVSAPLMTRFPQDLFFPQAESGNVVERKSMDLPGGLHGQMELVYRTVSDPENGLMQASERQVVTRIDDEELRSSENWRLASI